MALKRIECPECGAGLKSSSGFDPGESVACPKCETYFTVEEPDDAEEERPAKKKAVKAVASRVDDEDDDDRPKKKKKKKRSDDDDEERSYKSSPARYAILGVLVVVMIVLGVFLVLKMKREKEDANSTAGGDPPANTGGQPQIPGGGGQPKLQNPGGNLPMGPGAVTPKLPGGGLPKFPNNPPKFPNNPPPFPGGAQPADPLSGLFGEVPRPGTAENIQLMDALGKKLVGTWEGTDPDGVVHKVTYQASGQYTHDVGGKPTSGTWQATGLVGRKVIKIARGNATIKIAFEGDELLHDTSTPGQSVVLRKK